MAKSLNWLWQSSRRTPARCWNVGSLTSTFSANLPRQSRVLEDLKRPRRRTKGKSHILYIRASCLHHDSFENLIPPKEKTEAEIHAEIQAIIRQITASITFLPMLEGRCTFNVLVYADADANVPDEEWGDSDAKEVKNAENVKLRSFSTMNHKIDTMVSYRLDAEEY